MFSWVRRLFQKTIATGISSPFSSQSPVQNRWWLKTQLWKTPLVLPVTPFFLCTVRPALDLFPCFKASPNNCNLTAQRHLFTCNPCSLLLCSPFIQLKRKP